MAKFADFRRKNADVSRTQGVCHVIHIFFGSPLGKFRHCRICATDFRPPPPPPSVSSPEKADPE